VRFPHGALLALGGMFSPDLQCSGGLSPGPFCVEVACSPQTFSAQVGYLPGLSVWSLQVLPRPSVLSWAISRAFLCGVCMFSHERQCSGGLSPGPFCVEFACSPQTFSAQVGYLPGL